MCIQCARKVGNIQFSQDRSESRPFQCPNCAGVGHKWLPGQDPAIEFIDGRMPMKCISCQGKGIVWRE